VPRTTVPTRTRILVVTTCVVGALGAGVAGVASAQTIGHRAHGHHHATGQLGEAAHLAGYPTTRRSHWPHPTRTASPSPTPSESPTASPSPTDSPSPTTSPTPSESPTTVPPTTTAPPPSDSVIDQALAHINAARTAAGVGTLTLSADLSKASEAHNALMVGGCGLSHQCPGEAGLGERFTAAGVSWTSAGENIGQGNASDTAASILQAANGLTDLMLAEQPPNDGHRKNLLNPGFKRIGLAVTRGSDGRVWFTQDFVN
jgi:uncharacterized protein YkwD